MERRLQAPCSGGMSRACYTPDVGMGIKGVPKEDVARALLLRGSVYLHLDPRTEGVQLPAFFLDQSQAMVQIGLDLPQTPDLRVDDQGVTGNFAFGERQEQCTIPWRSVFAIAGEDGRGLVWHDEAFRVGAWRDEGASDGAITSRAPRDRRGFRVLQGSVGRMSRTPIRRRDHLRLVD